MCVGEYIRECARAPACVLILTISNAADEHQQKDHSALEMHGWKMEKGKIQ